MTGGVAGAFFGAAALVLGEAFGWWLVPSLRTTCGVAAIGLGLTISLAPVHLLAWRVETRFGWHGLAACIGLAAMVGPPRDYLFAAMFPTWIVFSRGVAPALAVTAIYAGWIALGHAAMRLVVGPGDRFTTISRHTQQRLTS